MTLREALEQVIALRPAGLSNAQFAAWERALTGYNPEDVVAAGERVARSWRYSTPWPIGALLAELPERPGEHELGTAFMFDVATGAWRGNLQEYLKLPREQRRQEALYLLSFRGAGGMLHESTAEAMCPGLLKELVDLAEQQAMVDHAEQRAKAAREAQAQSQEQARPRSRYDEDPPSM